MNRRSVAITRIYAIPFLWLALSLNSGTAFAQTGRNPDQQPTPQTQAFAGLNDPLDAAGGRLAGPSATPRDRDSRIGPDDLLDIGVFEAPEMNETVRVSASGEISLPLLGAIRAAGQTPRELEIALQTLLRRTYMNDPHVSVFIHELQSRAVSVVGAVKSPGVFQIRGAKTIIEVLSLAGGLSDDAGDKVLITRGARNQIDGFEDISLAPSAETEGVEIINLRKLLNSSDPALNAVVHPGDVIKVPRAGIVYVVGEVKKPGGFVLQNNENISVLQALALAEGLTHTSSASQARIIRTDPGTGLRTEIPMNLGKIFSGKAPDALLQPKDIVFVPNSTAKSMLYRGSEAAVQTAAGVAIYKW